LAIYTKVKSGYVKPNVSSETQNRRNKPLKFSSFLKTKFHLLGWQLEERDANICETKYLDGKLNFWIGCHSDDALSE